MNIEVKILEIFDEKVRIGIAAPYETPVHRDEIYQRIHNKTSKFSTKNRDIKNQNMRRLNGNR